jgi:hypothetical protein
MDFQLATNSPSQLATYRLEADRLVVEGDGRAEVVPFADIARINLQQTLGAYSAIIDRRSGRPVMIRSRCVLAGMKVEDRVADYGELLRQLHGACSPYHSTIAFVAGSTAKLWLSWLLLVISPGLLLLSGFAVADGRWRLWLLAVVAIGGFVAGLAGLKQGRGRPYDPKAPPATLLPREDHGSD